MTNTLRILVWRNGKLGNTISAIPFILELRRIFPMAHIAVVVESLGKELLRHYPEINELIIYEKKSAHRRIILQIRFKLYLRKRQFTHSIHLKRFFRNELLSLLSGIQERIGFFRADGTKGLLTRAIPYNETKNIVNCTLDLTQLFGDFKNETVSYRFYSSKEDVNAAKTFLRTAGVTIERFIVFHPGGDTIKGHGLSSEVFAEIAKALWDELGLTPILLKGPTDSISVDAMAKHLSPKIPYQICALRNIREIAEIMRRAALFIGNDSGPAHIAALVDTPSVILYGNHQETKQMIRKWLPWQKRVMSIHMTAAISTQMAVNMILQQILDWKKF